MDIQALIRPAIANLVPYTSAREQFSDQEMIWLDNNENSFGTSSSYNRYPSVGHTILKEKIAGIKNVAVNQIALGNGSDEIIDLLMRAFGEPNKDNILYCPPTFGMYSIAATINGLEKKEILQSPDFELNIERILALQDAQSKLLFLCSPNNPTGNYIPTDQIIKLTTNFNGLVILDEAYIDFCPENSLLPTLDKNPNLVILQTFSKGWGLAGLRLGMAFAHPTIIATIDKIRMPYNINSGTANLVSSALDNQSLVNESIEKIRIQRSILESQLKSLNCVEKVFPTDANFFLVRFSDAHAAYQHLLNHHILVSNRSALPQCQNTLRITVGTETENKRLIQALSFL